MEPVLTSRGREGRIVPRRSVAVENVVYVK